MTNKFLLLAAAAGTLAFASCNNETGGDAMTDEMMQAKIDSAVQSRMEEMQMQLALQNDSLINAMAMIKADSMMAANAGSNSGVRRTVPTRPSTAAPSTPAPTPSNPKQDKFDRKQGETTTATKAETEEKQNKFDRKAGK